LQCVPILVALILAFSAITFVPLIASKTTHKLPMQPVIEAT
jgi:hypothetical protein